MVLTGDSALSALSIYLSTTSNEYFLHSSHPCVSFSPCPGDYHQLDPPPSPSAVPPVPVVEEQWELSLSPPFLGVFIGSGGQHIKPLCTEHNVSVYFGKKKSRCGLLLLLGQQNVSSNVTTQYIQHQTLLHVLV